MLRLPAQSANHGILDALNTIVPRAANDTAMLLVVSYFVFGEGAAPGEAGSLLFFTQVPDRCASAL